MREGISEYIPEKIPKTLKVINFSDGKYIVISILISGTTSIDWLE